MTPNQQPIHVELVVEYLMLLVVQFHGVTDIDIFPDSTGGGFGLFYPDLGIYFT